MAVLPEQVLTQSTAYWNMFYVSCEMLHECFPLGGGELFLSSCADNDKAE